MNPRNNIRRKRRVNKRMRVYSAGGFRRLVRFANAVARFAAAMREIEASLPLPPSFKPGGIVSKNTGEEFVIPRRK